MVFDAGSVLGGGMASYTRRITRCIDDRVNDLVMKMGTRITADTAHTDHVRVWASRETDRISAFPRAGIRSRLRALPAARVGVAVGRAMCNGLTLGVCSRAREATDMHRGVLSSGVWLRIGPKLRTRVPYRYYGATINWVSSDDATPLP